MLSRLALILLSIAVIAPLGLADDYPARKAGLWEIKMTTSNSHGRVSPVMQQCIDAATDQKMFDMGKNMASNSGMTCQKNEFRKEGGNWISESVCSLGPTTMSSRGTFTGDFNSAYRAQIDTTYSPPMMGMASVTMVMDAKYKGLCATDQKPGDVIMPDGKKMNIISFMTDGPPAIH